MTIVTNIITDPGENPVKDATVRITLITGTNAPGYTSTGEVQGTYSLSTDATGTWSANLTPNSLITPAGTYYQVVEGRAVSNINVPATGGPYLLGSILVVPPTTPAALGITGVQVAANGTIAGNRPEINLIAGTNVTINGADNPGNNRVDVTVSVAGGLARTSVKTANYTALAGDLVPVDATTGAVTVTLPGAPADRTQVAVTLVTQGTGHTATIACAGTDVFTKTGGPTTLTLSLGQLAWLEYTAAAGIWTQLAGPQVPPWEFHVATYGAAGDNTTDDTAAANRAMTAAGTYLAAHGYAEVVFDPLTYLIGGAPTTGGATNGSAQIPLPVIAPTAQKGILVLRGTRDQSALYHWQQTTPQRAGAVLRSTYNGGNTIPATGEVSVIGGPTPHFTGDPPASWDNLLVVVDGITIELANPANMCGFDFRCVAEANVPNAAVLGSITGTGAPAVPAANWGFGLAMPVVNNNDNCNIGYFSVEGLVYGLVVYEHVEATSIRIINCFDGLVCWSSSGFPHRNKIHYASIEGCQRTIVLAGSFNKLDIDVADIEWGGAYIIDDVAAVPGIGRIGLCSNGNNGTSLSSALNSGPNAVNVTGGPLALEILNLDQGLGPVTPPAVPASATALTNPFWRHAQVHVSGGTVTAVAVDGVNQLSTSGAFDVPSGHSITLTYSVAPSWAWTLKG